MGFSRSVCVKVRLNDNLTHFSTSCEPTTTITKVKFAGVIDSDAYVNDNENKEELRNFCGSDEHKNPEEFDFEKFKTVFMDQC